MLRWFPWKQLVSSLARSRGLVDPVKLFARLESFAQPMEVREPLELLRAGLVFHARGLLNSTAIQYNLDWLWPYWVARQYGPKDDAFVPRAFSITHVNLTHRNWTAVGLPDFDALPIVDPRGLVTPFWDSWSLDVWLTDDDGHWLVPCRAPEANQALDLNDGVAVLTRTRDRGLESVSRAEVREGRSCPELAINLEGTSADRPAWLIAAVRPHNPEGVSFIHDLRLEAARDTWWIDERHRIGLAPAAEVHRVSDFHRGDVRAALDGLEGADSVHCPVGMASAAAQYRLEPGQPRSVTLRIPLRDERRSAAARPGRRQSWQETLAPGARLESPDARIRFLFDAAVRTLVLHSPGDVYPGPYTYKRFWFRDAAFILDGLLSLGLFDRVEPVLDTFPSRQHRNGHFFSQEGEWDSNGEALWIMDRYCRLRGVPPKPAWGRAVRRGARWIGTMRVDSPGTLHDGLMPTGFSAEHLGPNNYYYWDDLWSAGGLRAGASLLAALGHPKDSAWCRHEAADLDAAIDASLESVRRRTGRDAVPASPYRRLDAGAIGSLAGGYPLRAWPPRDPRLLDTVAFLRERCFVDGAFFQDMVHSGLNPYLTLHVAQVLLRAGDPEATDLVATVAKLASPTGQWPEAVHPRTGGGCMGDGQHAWAAAEWVSMIRNAFVREEEDALVLASGIPDAWLAAGLWRLGPTPTPFGPIQVSVEARGDGVRVSWRGNWHGQGLTKPPAMRIARPGEAPVAVAGDSEGALTVPRRFGSKRSMTRGPA